MKILSLFSGIGAFEKALDNLGVEYELVNYCEIDKYASKSYAAIHNVSEDKNLGDITKVNEKELPKDIDLITYGFPCQDISLAGKQKGLFNEDGTQTRSGLFFEALRIIEETQPRVAIAENVKNLIGKKFKPQFEIVLDSLDKAGYNNYWQVLNAKDYGIPQNRERVFIVSIRKDIDTGLFQFPQAFPLELRLKDMLEDIVDEKYYISKKIEDVMYNANSKETASQQSVVVKEATKKGYAEAFEGDSVNFDQPNSKTRRGRVGHSIAQTLTTIPQQGVVVDEGGVKMSSICVDCDECFHRSEDCLCDISENDEDCPLEKLKAKKVKQINFEIFECPSCKEQFYCDRSHNEINYCVECGQKFDWRE
jgi:DNA (cytosine-5)-methyltransferase 1